MAVFFDVLLVAIFLITVIRHASLGLACSVLNASRLLISLVLAAILCYPFASAVHACGIPAGLSGVVAFIAVFFGAMMLSKLLVKLLSRIKIPVVTKVDKFLGLLLGVLLGVIFTSLTATSIYTVLDTIATFSSEGDVMSAYNSSYIFKFVYELKIFEFIGNLF